jgi:23S rRNA pseudouridine1911/1915/1917 synthase
LPSSAQNALARPPARIARIAPMSTPRRPAAPSPDPDRAWVVPPELHGRPLDGVVRALAEVSWSEARRWIETGKIQVAGQPVMDPLRKAKKGDPIALHMRAPRPSIVRAQALSDDLFVYLDASVVVVRKPAGISTVPYGDEAPDEITLDALVRDALAHRDRLRGRAPLGVVQRLDKATSGVLVFARTFSAKKHLGQQLRLHTMERRYLAIVHGDEPGGTIRSHLVDDRGDGLRGSAAEGRREGQLAVTHVQPVSRLRGATLVGCRLETGRTHQIRIHLAERGHPLVGEAVYTRGYRGPLIPAPRLMLHAAALGFEHPADGRPMRFEDPLPDDFLELLERLR